MKEFDVIVIGAGLGGLSAGARLAHYGAKVLLLEQHSIPGGYATTFRRKHFDFEVSLHEMDGLDQWDMKNKLFEELKVRENVNFLRIPEFYHFRHGNLKETMPDSVDAAHEKLLTLFPEEKKGIQKFFKTMIGLRHEVSRLPADQTSLTDLAKIILQMPAFPLIYPNLVRHMKTNLGDFLDNLFRSEEIKLFLSANLYYYHDDPYSMSLLYYSVAQAGFLEGGGYYIRGGSQKLSDYFASLIESNGGEIRYNADATQILSENEKVSGVLYRDKKNGEEHTVETDFIIANASVPQVVERLMPAGSLPRLEKKYKTLKTSLSLMTLYIGFSQPPANFGNAHYSTFFFDPTIRSLKDIKQNLYGDINRRSWTFVDYGQIDSALAPTGKSVGAIVTADIQEDWPDRNTPEYKKRKKEVTATLLQKLETEFPGITAAVEFSELGTSRTNERYTMNPSGAVYGYAQTPEQAGLNRLSQTGEIKGLYFASAWSNPGGGFTGAMLSGFMATQPVLRKLR